MTIKYPIFTSRHSVGLTFVSWSYHWLLGHTETWNSHCGYCDIPTNPNTGFNAHHFNKNYTAGLQEWKDFVLDEKNNLDNCSMYGGTIKHYSCLDEINKDYADSILFASEHAPTIFYVEPLENPWYFLYPRAIDPANGANVSIDEIQSYRRDNLNRFLEKYYNDSLSRFSNSIWEIRELVSLNFEYFKADRSYLDLIDIPKNCLYVDSRELWYNGEQHMQRLFDYLGKTIVSDRVPHWRTIYQEWQSKQLKTLQFDWYLPKIIESIVNNHSFDLTFLDLNLMQEAVIQGTLIKKYNLNLKSYGLEKFPADTKDLHAILEKNTHQNKEL